MIGPPLAPARFWRLSAAGAVSFVALWSAIALSGLTSREFMPAPWDVLLRFGQLLVTPFAGYRLHEHLLSSLQRFGMGFGLAVLVGMISVALSGWLMTMGLGWLERRVMPWKAIA